MDNKYPFVNTPLRYPYNALEPYIDEKNNDFASRAGTRKHKS